MIPVSVTLAQSAQETGWGKSVKNNAYFGIKGKSPEGNTTSFTTSEYIDGKKSPKRIVLGVMTAFKIQRMILGGF
ncbi:glucosaminidase domain-containing protein [Erwiniaceae bacterium CAU 1747]